MFPVGVQLGFFSTEGMVSLGENKVIINRVSPRRGSVVRQRVVLCWPSVECLPVIRTNYRRIVA